MRTRHLVPLMIDAMSASRNRAMAVEGKYRISHAFFARLNILSS